MLMLKPTRSTFLCLLLGQALLAACDTEEERYRTEMQGALGKGETMEVTRFDRFEEHVGVISQHSYGRTHGFHYEFVIQPGSHSWSGEDGQVPEQLLRCGDSSKRHWYLRYSQREVVVPEDPHERPTETTTVEHLLLYEDRRYFYNLLGNESWSFAVEPAGACSRYDVPVHGSGVPSESQSDEP